MPCSSLRWRASLPQAVVLPEPWRPATRITVGPGLANTRSRPAPPISSVSSSETILTTCWPGLSDSSTSCPVARSLTAAVNSLTTLKFTSASSRARRTWRIALETSSSLSLPRERTSPRAAWSRSESVSNTRPSVLCGRGQAPRLDLPEREAAQPPRQGPGERRRAAPFGGHPRDNRAQERAAAAQPGRQVNRGRHALDRGRARQPCGLRTQHLCKSSGTREDRPALAHRHGLPHARRRPARASPAEAQPAQRGQCTADGYLPAHGAGRRGPLSQPAPASGMDRCEPILG